MSVFFEQTKTAFWIAITFILSHITNVSYALWVLLIGFFVNILIGIGADVHNGKKQFNIKKATEGMKLLMFYFIIVFFLYAITYRNLEMSDTVVSWLTYIVSYFYLTNIFRNAKKIFPRAQSIKFIYEFLSTEIFYRLKDYIGWKPREEGNHENK